MLLVGSVYKVIHLARQHFTLRCPYGVLRAGGGPIRLNENVDFTSERSGLNGFMYIQAIGL